MLREQINDALKVAMRAKDDVGLRTVRLIIAALKDRDIAARGNGNCEGISDDELLGMLQSMVKQRKESMQLYVDGGRQELADQEAAEIKVIERFLPQQLGEDEMAEAVSNAIKSTGAGGIKDMGKVMGALKSDYAGRMDFSKASQIVKERLAT
ncbi:MAG: GatB/YqeY domain-containing protein [Rhodospirillales bacterium]